MTTTSEAVLKVEAALRERDKRIDQLERDLKEARKPRSRMVLIGGPQDGDTVLFAPNPSSPYYVTIQPRNRSAVEAWDIQAPVAHFFTETVYYRVERVRTGDGERFVGLYERTV